MSWSVHSCKRGGREPPEGRARGRRNTHPPLPSFYHAYYWNEQEPTPQFLLAPAARACDPPCLKCVKPMGRLLSVGHAHFVRESAGTGRSHFLNVRYWGGWVARKGQPRIYFRTVSLVLSVDLGRILARRWCGW